MFQGGSGSSKTYTILQYFIIKSLNGDWNNEVIDILRRTTPSLTRSVMFDFFKIINELGIYKLANHNRSHLTYKLGTNLFRFYSTDEENKVRGPRRDRVYFNEALELKKIDVNQVMMRTHKQCYFDYNPSEEFHWIYEDILTRKDVTFDISTYKDNLFLAQASIDEIENYKTKDPNMWRIYGLGQRGISEATVFKNWEYAETTFDEFEGQVLYGADWGFNDPTALVRIKYHEKGIFVEQLLYKTDLTSDAIVREYDKLKKLKLLDSNSTIYADSARPEIIRALRNANYNIHAVKKGPQSVLAGIDFLKRHKIHLNKESIELIRETRNYKWKVDKDGKVLDEPVDLNNHLVDSTRYAINSKLKQRTTTLDIYGNPINRNN